MKKLSQEECGRSCAPYLSSTAKFRDELKQTLESELQGNPCSPHIDQVRLISIINTLLGGTYGSPSRRIVTGSGPRTRGWFPSRRFGASQGWESPLERSFIRQMQLSSLLVGLYSQPARLRLPTGEGVLDYTPDCLVINIHGEFVFVECKPKSKLQDEELARRLEAIRQWFEALGIRFLVLTEDDLGDKVLHTNVANLLGFVCPSRLNQHLLAPLALEIESLLPQRLGDLDPLGHASTMTALANGLVAVNLREPLVASSRIFLKNERSSVDVANYI